MTSASRSRLYSGFWQHRPAYSGTGQPAGPHEGATEYSHAPEVLVPGLPTRRNSLSFFGWERDSIPLSGELVSPLQI
jgi:hypothetical protein